ncbi:MAG: ABC transporter ATP-binding protein [Caldilineaceae bacterium]|nr:ABC transporter ATP-binding protein [Caldilineaceae bacterium]
MSQNDLLLEVKDLKTQFFTDDGVVRAVDGVNFELKRGEILCVVGESGCGKSVTARSILQIVDPPGRVAGGEILFHRRNGHAGARETTAVVDLAALDPRGREIREIRGKDIAMIFQEPMTSLSPIHTVGDQITEAIMLHMALGKEEARARAVEMLRRVGIPRPADRLDAYTFQLSGGMRQRAMIAMALSCNPQLLIADEPTTALDVTTQAQILDLMRELQRDFGMSIMLITHDLGVVAEMADDVVVMYLGTVAERGTVFEIFHDPKHPYTRALLRSIPKLGLRAADIRLDSIRGMVPDPYNRPAGCPYHTRCDDFMPGLCDRIEPPPIQLEGDREVRCLLYGGADPALVEAATLAKVQ